VINWPHKPLLLFDQGLSWPRCGPQISLLICFMLAWPYPFPPCGKSPNFCGRYCFVPLRTLDPSTDVLFHLGPFLGGLSMHPFGLSQRVCRCAEGHRTVSSLLCGISCPCHFFPTFVFFFFSPLAFYFFYPFPFDNFPLPVFPLNGWVGGSTVPGFPSLVCRFLIII